MRIRAVICGVFILAVSAIAKAESPRPTMREFLGICGHTVQFRPQLYAPVCSLVRDYHPVEWDLADKTATLPEFPFAKNRVNWQAVYGSWAEAKFQTDACLMLESIPPDGWENREEDFAAYVTAFAKQFGPSGRTPLVETVEIGNEPGKYSDDEYAGLLRAAAPEIKRVDAKLKVATCNLTTGKSGPYDKSVDTLLADPAVLPAIDVLTLHTYAQAEPYPTWRRSYPEDPALNYLSDVKKLAAWRDEHAAGKQIWVTEFGYDATTKTPDPATEFAKWVGVSELQQAQYLVRSVLVFSALPVDRAYIYFFNDADEPKLHGSSGITRKFEPKPAFHALAQMQAILGEYRLARVLKQQAGELYAYEFSAKDPAAPRIVVAWSPTGSGRSSSADLGLPAGTRITRTVPMALGKDAPDDLPVPAMTAVPISESPLYLFLTAGG